MSCTVKASSTQLAAAVSNQQYAASLAVAQSPGHWVFWLYVVAYARGMGKADGIQANW